MGLNLQSHQWTKDKRTGQMVVEKVNHYADLAAMNGPRIILQAGKAYQPDGTVIPLENLPTWVYEQLELMPPQLLKDIEWTDQTAPAKRIKVSSSAENKPEDLNPPPSPETEDAKETDPLAMKFFALKAWAKREHGIEGATREDILARLADAGAITLD